MKRILFVDDEQKVLDGLQRSFYSLRHVWRMSFATSGSQALAVLDESDYDVLITDLRMPGMSGFELLTKVVNRHPHVVRMVLSGTTEQDTAVHSATLAHHCLAKPCDPATLHDAVERAFSLKAVFDDPVLKQLVSGLTTLPSVPSLYLQLMEVLASPDVSPKDVAQVIGQDIAMTAKILQFVNSARFGVQRQITDTTQAVIYLGPELVRQLVLVTSVFSSYRGSRGLRFSIEDLQSHSLAVGSLARRIARSLELSAAVADHVFVGGLLHDVGKLLLASNYPDKYNEAMRRAHDEGILYRIAEVQTFGTTHAEVGAYLLWSWALPDPIADMVLRHHEFPSDPAKVASPAVAVHIADALVNGDLDENTSACFTAIGLGRELADWQQMYSEEPAAAPASH